MFASPPGCSGWCVLNIHAHMCMRAFSASIAWFQRHGCEVHQSREPSWLLTYQHVEFLDGAVPVLGGSTTGRAQHAPVATCSSGSERHTATWNLLLMVRVPCMAARARAQRSTVALNTTALAGRPQKKCHVSHLLDPDQLPAEHYAELAYNMSCDLTQCHKTDCDRSRTK